ncbi:MAG: exodeoxyribonuclease VII large subunit [Labilithrix sp.]|nr:exodeoxyribonuclease VII large subunit [Labilithrix sp.]MCW5815417.1 exodeoxyribonuclease VII large subunit [Labilithrix sp.]
MAKGPKRGETIAFDFALLPPRPAAPPVSEEAAAERGAPDSRAPGVAEPGAPATRPAMAAAETPWTPDPLPTRNEPWAPAPLPERREPVASKPEGPRVLTVGQLGRVVGRSLERTFAAELWVEGEVSGARPAASGHVYFCMKDEAEDASIDVVLYRSSVSPRGRALVKDGARIKVRGKPTYWSPRGKLQFVGDRVEPTGKGALLEALEKLKEKLSAEGLFAQERKRALPHDPRVVGVVTSASGAVIHDICKVAFRRGGAHILLAAAQVQGPGAVDSIRRALRLLQRVAAVDVIVIGRGGGSSDDLGAFNDEHVVRDVAACRVPIVSAVGHEVDVTLVDFAADARAATPSQAAEMIVPDLGARRKLLEERTRRLERAMRARLAEDRAENARLMRAFGDPRLLIASAQQRVDELTLHLGRLAQRRIANEKDAALALDARLRVQHPQLRIARDGMRLADLDGRLAAAARHLVREETTRTAALAERLRQTAPELVRTRSANAAALGEQLARVAPALVRARAAESASLAERLHRVAPHLVRDRAAAVAKLAARLDAMSPLKVLARGYAIVTRAEDGRAVRDAAEVTPGDTVHVRVGEGGFDATVERSK